MTFEEFFKKKKIDLAALQIAQPGLFSEFKEHYEQMGEKSFDHTKKYWFNKLRLQYHLAPEVKAEKVHIENKLAEQTITESLGEAAQPATGFKPRFKPGMAGKPADTSDKKDLPIKESATVTPEVNEAAERHDQQPAFQQEKEAMQQAADEMPRTTDEDKAGEEQPTTLRTGFKPRFNMKMAQGNAPQTKQFEQEDPKEEQPAADKTDSTDTPSDTSATASRPAGFKPRFNAKAMAAKPAQDISKTESEQEQKPTEPLQDKEQAASSEPAAAKPAGFKSRFNMKMIAPKPAEEQEATSAETSGLAEEPTVVTTEDKTANDNGAKPEETAAPAPKVGFKPRFNAKTTKPQPPKEDKE